MHYEERFGAREVKFLVAASQSAAIREWAAARLEADPHAAPGSASYGVTSLYFDNDRFDVFHRRGSYGRAKYRVRRYGQSPSVFLERKLRTEETVAKRRCAVDLDEVGLIAADVATWSGRWFQRRLTARRLHPVCRVGYQRTAFVTRGEGGSTARLTLDRGLEAMRIDAPVFGEAAPSVAVSPDSEILELKYAGAMPPVFKQLLETFIVQRTPFSKYRAAMAALGIAA